MQQLEVFIGNLNPNVTEEELRQIFLQFGEIIYVKIPTSRGCGFVQFTARASAEEAIQRMQGTMISQQAVHLSWGRSPTAKQDLPGVWSQQADPSQWSSTYYGYGQGYDAYGNGTTHDPSLYAYGAYPGYAQYPLQVEGSQEMASMAGAVPAVEQRKEYDPLATPDVDKLNAAYLALPSMEVPFWAGPCGREPHQSHSKHRLLWKNLFYLSVSNWFWCANVTETKTIISKKTAVPEGNPGKFCFCT